jgi:hypothetical protein
MHFERNQVDSILKTESRGNLCQFLLLHPELQPNIIGFVELKELVVYNTDILFDCALV